MDRRSISDGNFSYCRQERALHDQGAKLLSNAAVADGLVALLIYPDRTDITTYWDGDAIFSFSNDADFGSAITQSVDFTGNGILAPCGFA